MVVVAVDGANAAPAGWLHRLVRRSLLIAAFVAVGWLLSVLFASSASAAEEPAGLPPEVDEHAGDNLAAAEPAARPASASEQSGGLTGVLRSVTQAGTHAVTDTVATLTHAVVDTTHDALAPAPTAPSGRPVQPLPDLSGGERAFVAPTPTAPHQPPATPAAPVTVVPAPEHTPRAPVVAIQHGTRTSSQHGSSGEHAARHAPDQPARSPAPLAPGTVFNSHDNAGGERGAHGVLTVSAESRPPTAGHTTRSRTADATGRIAGLPAISPD